MVSLSAFALAVAMASQTPVVLTNGCHKTVRASGGLHRHARDCARIAVKRRPRPGSKAAATVPWGPGLHCHRDQREDHASGKHAHGWASCKPVKSGEQSTFTTH